MPSGGRRDGEPGEGGEVAVGADVAGDGVDPDLAGDLPALPPRVVATTWKALLGMPELMCTPPLSSVVST